jgi:hypothetical protein
MHPRGLWLVVLAACGGGHSAPTDAAPPTWATVGPVTVLPLLPGSNHASETSIAAHGDDVVVLAVNQTFDSADSYAYPTDDLPRFDTAWASHDGAETFGAPIDIGGGNVRTTDPVIRADATGRFWAVGVDIDGEVNPGPGPPTTSVVFTSSADRGDTWAAPTRVQGFDKDWIAVDDSDGTAFVCANNAVIHVDATGAILATSGSGSATDQALCSNGYVDAGGFHFVDGLIEIRDWVPGAGPSTEVAARDPGPAANLWTKETASLGTTGAQQWLVRAQRNMDGAPVLVELFEAGALAGSKTLTDDGAIAFLPAAALDADGILHVVWYESTGAHGILRYTHSLTTDLTGDYEPPVTVDADACPGDRWYPYTAQDNPPGGRRLREYIDITTANGHTYVTWTRADAPPARVLVARVDG